MIPALRGGPLPASALLAVSEHGRVTVCSCCNEVEVVFGNAVFRVDAAGLQGMITAIDMLKACPSDRSDSRAYLLRPSMRQPIAFGFSRTELIELDELVSHALTSARGTESDPATCSGLERPMLPLN